jgi:hypothetical protein
MSEHGYQKVMNFPICRNAVFIRAVVDRLVENDGFQSESFWKSLVMDIAEDLIAGGVPMEIANAELGRFQQSVLFELQFKLARTAQ